MDEGPKSAALPTKRTFRRLIIASGLGIAVLGAWSYWPRRDVRLLGKWVRAESDPLGDNVFEFHADGQGSCGPGGSSASSFHWMTRGSRLQLTYGRQPGWEGVIDRLRRLVGQPSLTYAGQEYEVSDVREDGMTWKLVSPGQRITAESEEAFEVRRVRP